MTLEAISLEMEFKIQDKIMLLHRVQATNRGSSYSSGSIYEIDFVLGCKSHYH